MLDVEETVNPASILHRHTGAILNNQYEEIMKARDSVQTLINHTSKNGHVPDFAYNMMEDRVNMLALTVKKTDKTLTHMYRVKKNTLTQNQKTDLHLIQENNIICQNYVDSIRSILRKSGGDITFNDLQNIKNILMSNH